MARTEGRRKIKFSNAWEAMLFPFTNLLGLLRLSLLPTLIATAIVFGAYLLLAPDLSLQISTPEDMDRFTRAIFPLMILAWLLYVVVAIIMAVGIHRLILRGERMGWTLLRVRGYELAYAAAAGLFFAAAIAEQYIFVFIGQLFGIVFPAPGGGTSIAEQQEFLNQVKDLPVAFMVAGVLIGLALIWVHVRLALVFPHAAVTGRISLSASWTAMRGNVWRFLLAAVMTAIMTMFLYLVIVLALGLLGGVVAMVVISLGGGAPAQIQTETGAMAIVVFPLIFGLLSNWLAIAVVVAFVSFAYKDLIDAPAPSPQTLV